MKLTSSPTSGVDHLVEVVYSILGDWMLNTALDEGIGISGGLAYSFGFEEVIQ